MTTTNNPFKAAAASAFARVQKTLGNYEERITALEAKKSVDPARIAALHAEIRDVRDAMDKAETPQQVVAVQNAVRDINPRVTSLEEAVAKLRKDVDTNTRDIGTVRSQSDSNAFAIKALGERAAEDHDVLQTTVLPQLIQLGVDVEDLQDAVKAGTVSNPRSFITYLKGRGVTDEKLRSFLVLPRLNDDEPDLDLTDPELFDELLRFVRTTSEETMRRLTKVEGRVDTLDTKVIGIGDRVTTIEKQGSDDIKPIDFLLGAVVGVAGFFIFTWFGWGETWQRIIGAIALAGFAAVVISWFNKRRTVRREKNTTKTKDEKHTSTSTHTASVKSDSNPTPARTPQGPDNTHTSVSSGNPSERTPEPAPASS